MCRFVMPTPVGIISNKLDFVRVGNRGCRLRLENSWTDLTRRDDDKFRALADVDLLQRLVAPRDLVIEPTGTFVAVPAGIAYNQFTARLRVFASGIDDFSRELLNSLEEIPQRSAAAPGQAGGPRPMNPMDREV